VLAALEIPTIVDEHDDPLKPSRSVCNGHDHDFMYTDVPRLLSAFRQGYV
jgi:hypothetical protein